MFPLNSDETGTCAHQLAHIIVHEKLCCPWMRYVSGMFVYSDVTPRCWQRPVVKGDNSPAAFWNIHSDVARCYETTCNGCPVYDTSYCLPIYEKLCYHIPLLMLDTACSCLLLARVTVHSATDKNIYYQIPVRTANRFSITRSSGWAKGYWAKMATDEISELLDLS